MPQDLGLLSHCSFPHFAFSETRSSCPSRKDQAAKNTVICEKGQFRWSKQIVTSQTDLLGSRLPESVVGLWERNATWAPTLKQHLGIHCAWKNINKRCFPKLLPKSKGSTWVKRSDGDSGKVFCPVGGEHAAAELGVGVGGVGGEGGLGGQLSILAFCSGWGTALFNFCAYLRP